MEVWILSGQWGLFSEISNASETLIYCFSDGFDVLFTLDVTDYYSIVLRVIGQVVQSLNLIIMEYLPDFTYS